MSMKTKGSAKAVMQSCFARPVVLPKGADPELGVLLGLESTRSVASATARRPVRAKPSSPDGERPASEGAKQ